MKEEKIAIITDSSSGLPAELLAKNDIQVINIPTRVGEKVYREGAGLDPLWFQAEMAETDQVPVLEQLPVSVLQEQMNNLRTAGYTDALYILLSGGISPLASKVEACANLVDGLKVTVSDSLTAGASPAQMAQLAVAMRRDGCDVSEILTALREYQGSSATLLVLRNLRQLNKHGYVSNGSTLVSNILLRLKTLALFDETGRLVMVDTQSRLKTLYKEVTKRAHKDYLNLQDRMVITIMETPDRMSTDSLDEIREQLTSTFPKAKVVVKPFPPSLITITGAHSAGITWGPDWEFLALKKN